MLPCLRLRPATSTTTTTSATTTSATTTTTTTTSAPRGPPARPLLHLGGALATAPGRVPASRQPQSPPRCPDMGRAPLHLHVTGLRLQHLHHHVDAAVHVAAARQVVRAGAFAILQRILGAALAAAAATAVLQRVLAVAAILHHILAAAAVLHHILSTASALAALASSWNRTSLAR